MRLLLLMLVAIVSPAIAKPPSVITPAVLGAQTFSEDFTHFDAGPYQPTIAKPPHRWNTMLKGGLATDVFTRQITGYSIAVDPSLGINPFVAVPYSLQIKAGPLPLSRVLGLWGRPYFGGNLTTKSTFFQLFGYFEAVMKPPVTAGAYSAFWLLPTQGAWPVNGEIDVVEHLGNEPTIYTTVHSDKLPATKAVQGKSLFDFRGHAYGVAWDADDIVWYVDRKEVFRTRTPADMKAVPMFLILSNGVGNAWDSTYPNLTSRWPATLVVNSVRAWKLK